MTNQNIISRIIVLGFTVVFVTACSDTIARQDIARLSQELKDLRTFQAEQTSKISEIDSDVHKVSGRLDELEYQQNQRLGSVVNNLQSDLTQLKRRVPPPAIVPAQELEEDEDALNSLPKELIPPMTEVYANIREGNFERSVQVLDDALGLSLDTEWAAPVLFWRAVSFEGLNNNRGALENYLELGRKFPNYGRVGLSMLRQASVLIRLGDKKTARIVLNKVISDAPKSTNAQRAREKLKDL